jgi:hypothetical protein
LVCVFYNLKIAEFEKRLKMTIDANKQPSSIKKINLTVFRPMGILLS